MRFDTYMDAYYFYCSYVERSGFFVRIRGRLVRKSKSDADTPTYHRYVCTKEGFSRKRKSAPAYKELGMQDPIPPDYENVQIRQEIRCGFTSYMVVNYLKSEKKFHIAKWVGEHYGRSVIPKELAYLQCFNRSVDVHEGLMAELNDSVGIPLDRSYRLLCRGARGAQNVGCLKVDLKNHLRTRRQKKMDPSEAVCVQQYMRNAAQKSPGFFYEIQYDVDNMITKIFWVNSCMIMDYNMFGDCITFDTTYRTNRTYRPLALFVGFNNHRQIIVFGASLLYDETTASFEWLFRTFMGCMNNHALLTMFTDQDAAMAAAIKSTLPTTYHFLCMWHILQNAKSKLHASLHDSVSHTLVHLMYHVEDENEFNQTWNDMLMTHFTPTNHGTGLVKSKAWLQKTKPKRKKWSNAWVRKRFTGGMRSTQASESVNGTVRGFLKSDQRLIELLPHFEEMSENMRQRENLKEFESLDKVPKNMFKLCPIACKAASLYTPTIMNWFHYEREHCCGYLIARYSDTDDTTDEGWFVYKMDENEQQLDRRLVHFDTTSSKLRCSCCLYESVGILCRHILKFMIIQGGLGNFQLRTLPDHYINKRWCRYVRRSFLADRLDENERSSARTTYACLYQRVTATTVALASVVSYDVALYADVIRELSQLLKVSQERMKVVNLKSPTVNQPRSSAHTMIPNMSTIGEDRLCAGIKMRLVKRRLNKHPQSFLEVYHQQTRANFLRKANANHASDVPTCATGAGFNASSIHGTDISDERVNIDDVPPFGTALF